ncbi:beta-galactosidase-like [Ornithodoros turicata]|uniref:beta-galactosidase-like n=1 Tax=Ornithodoros turicata TaxID=34597 RepID=UPI00313A4125
MRSWRIIRIFSYGTIVLLFFLIMRHSGSEEVQRTVPFSSETVRSFIIDYSNNQFLKDGRAFQYIGGEMHYFRVPRELWKDRLKKLKAAGLNVVQTVVEWSGHQPAQNRIVFEGNYNLSSFLKEAQKVGLLVTLRPGPYIGAGRDNGGFPYWLSTRVPREKWRTSDDQFLDVLDKWLDILLPTVKTFLYENGGPVIMIQLESGRCDGIYKKHIFQVFRAYLGRSVPLFTVGTVQQFPCSKIGGALTTVNVGVKNYAQWDLNQTRRANGGKGPVAVTEYRTGCFDTHNFAHAPLDIGAVLKNLDTILKHNASVVLYMFHGGTNFGFSNGATAASPHVTSYDYRAPLSEAGDPTVLYYEIRRVISKYVPLLPLTEEVSAAPKLGFGPITMLCGPSLRDVMRYFRNEASLKITEAKTPLSFEAIGHGYGYVLYETPLPTFYGSMKLSIPKMRDRAYIFGDSSVYVMQRSKTAVHLKLRNGPLSILVENTGRYSSGKNVGEQKGILSNVSLGEHVLINWTMQAVPINEQRDVNTLFAFIKSSVGSEDCTVPRFFFGSFILEEGQEPLDTFLDTEGWTKGVAFLNGFNLGRYWPVVGPQVTLYVPGSVVLPYPQENYLVLFETEGLRLPGATVKLVTVPRLNDRTTLYKAKNVVYVVNV